MGRRTIAEPVEFGNQMTLDIATGGQADEQRVKD